MHFVDREAKYPNRWTIIKADGTSEVVTLVRNDEPIVEGTPMNAETLNTLSDVAGADIARQQAEAAREAAAGSATIAASAADAAEKSKAAAATSESNATKHEEAAKKAAEEAWAKAGADKTLSIENAPADAAVVGGYIIDRTKDTPELVFYSKAETDAKIKEMLNRQREEDYAKIKFWISDDPTSPAELFGGTWERIEGKFIIGASDTYPAWSTGGSTKKTLKVSQLPSHNHRINNMCWGGKGLTNTPHPDGYFWVFGRDASAVIANSYIGNTGDGEAVDVLNPYYSMYIWRRVA